MPAWPITLPAPLVEGYSLRPADAIAATAFEAGNLRGRCATADAPTLIDVRWKFTEADMADFEYFHAVTLDGGADAFDINLYNGLGANSYSASFDSEWQASLLPGGGYHVSATLRIAAREILTAAELEVAVAYDLDDIASAASPLHTLVHTTLPGTYWVYS